MTKKFNEYHKINEEGVAYAGASTSGMGAVVSAQPGSVPGAAITGDGTTGSGDIAVPYSVTSKLPVNLNNKKKTKKEKEPKKYKFSDLIKFEDFDTTKHLLENLKVEEDMSIKINDIEEYDVYNITDDIDSYSGLTSNDVFRIIRIEDEGETLVLEFDDGENFIEFSVDYDTVKQDIIII